MDMHWTDMDMHILKRLTSKRFSRPKFGGPKQLVPLNILIYKYLFRHRVNCFIEPFKNMDMVDTYPN
jgi:hypothetical protein